MVPADESVPSEGQEREHLADLLCNMGRIKLGENLDLLLDVLNLVFCTLEIYDLDRHCALCPLFIPARRKGRAQTTQLRSVKKRKYPL